MLEINFPMLIQTVNIREGNFNFLMFFQFQFSSTGYWKIRADWENNNIHYLSGLVNTLVCVRINEIIEIMKLYY